MDRTVRPVPDRTGPWTGPYPATVRSNGGSVLPSPENGLCRPVPCGTVDRAGPWTVQGANGETGSVFSNLDRLGLDSLDRAGPWTVRVWTGPSSLFNTLIETPNK
jgi:hypothetical protein